MNRYLVKKTEESILNKAESSVTCWEEELGYRKYGNARILPQMGRFLSGGVSAQDGTYLKDTSFVEDLYDGSYPYNESIVEYRNKDAVFLGCWFPVYGHAITDSIKRLWFLFSPEFQELKESAEKEGKEIDLAFVYLGGTLDVAGYMKDILRTLGLDINSFTRIIGNVVQYNNVYIPDNSLIEKDRLRHWTSQYKFLVNKICDYCRDDNGVYPEKVYLTRTAINDGKDFGEKELENIFAQRGFTVFSPEKMTFQQQVALMQHCRILVSTEGSVSHNSQFCKDGTQVVILRKADAYNEYTYMINSLRNLDVTYVEAHHTILSRVPWGGHFFLWRTKYLNRYLGENVREKSRWFSLMWYRYLIAYLRFELHPQVQKVKSLFRKK